MKENHLVAFAMQLTAVNPLAGNLMHWILMSLPYAAAFLTLCAQWRMNPPQRISIR